MVDPVLPGWPGHMVGELDHRLLLAPSLKLRSAKRGAKGDIVYAVDLRVRRPNADSYLTSTELHSVEHFLLEGFQRLLPDHFLSVGLMGCETGFYLGFLNEGRAAVLSHVLGEILAGILEADAVPYANIEQCGHYENHSVEAAKRIATEILQRKKNWLDAV